jgi:SAM-dependent methyltransferase
MTDYNSSLDLIARLVKQFHTNRAAYHAPEYKEADARQELIDPLFVALGWDVHNEQHNAPQYREVIPEKSLDVEGQKKAPDYAFRQYTTTRFFVEAKKPGVAIKTAAGPAYQLRRYAWSAKLPFSLLTDFEELAVYDCRSRPSEKHKASVGRTNYYTFEEYPDRWREIWDVFSREAVWGGSFDQFIRAKGRPTSEVDAEFLREIEGWRDVLARTMALRNPRLGIDDLNDAVQRTIDRILFLRMAEDRGIEPYEQLGHLAEKEGVYGELIDLCGKADARYNAGLFDLSPKGDPITPTLSVDDSVLKPIITGLYFPQCPYEFSVLPIMVLGNIYEQFLGKVIRLTASHQAKVEEKPEVRKAGGVFYTPTYIVDYNVKNTVGKMVQGKSPKQLATFRVLDMACGSGSFLLGAYQFLLDYYLSWYVEHNPEKQTQAVWKRGDEWRLTIAEKKRILTTHIFGVDIDRQAVEVTKLSLLLKVLEGESMEALQMALPTFQERALPNLDNNIKCGNSLIGPDYFTGQLLPNPDELRRVNPFDWEHEFPEAMKAGGFDCIVGNPPWGADLEAVHSYLVSRYPPVPTKTKDSYFYFISRALELVRPAGFVGFIVPNTWLLINNAQEFRRELLSLDVREIIDHGDGVFKQAIVESATLILVNKKASDNCRAVRIRKGRVVVDHLVDKQLWLDDEYSRIIVDIDPSVKRLVDKLRNTTDPFETTCSIIWGIKPYQVGYGIPPQTREMVDKRIYHAATKRGKDWKPLLVGSGVNRYTINFPGDQFIKYGKWLMYPSNETRMLQPKILMRQTSDTIRACCDDKGYYCQNSVFIIHSDTINLYFLLGILNSKLFDFLYKMGNPQTGKVFAEIKPSVIKQLPICRVNFSDPADVARHDRMVALVEQMLELHNRLAAASQSDRDLYQRQIDATDREIDKLVYELYGLTPDEIAIVEGQR